MRYRGENFPLVHISLGWENKFKEVYIYEKNGYDIN